MIARLTVMGISAVAVVGTVCGLAIYGFINRPDHDLTQQLMAVVLVAAGSLLGGVSKFFTAETEERQARQVASLIDKSIE